jgi:hypothetical protein
MRPWCPTCCGNGESVVSRVAPQQSAPPRKATAAPNFGGSRWKRVRRDRIHLEYRWSSTATPRDTGYPSYMGGPECRHLSRAANGGGPHQRRQSQARLLAGQQPKAGAWLHALPSSQMVTHHLDNTFRISCALRLGCTICEPHLCGSCGAQVKANGLQGLSCAFSRGRHSRHKAGNDIIARALRTAECPCDLEPERLVNKDGRHPDGLTIAPWKRGKHLLWDFTCVDTFAPSYVHNTSRYVGHAVDGAEDNKKTKYHDLLAAYYFVPVGMETSGVDGREELRLIKAIGQRLKDVTGEPRSLAFLLQHMSIAVQRGNAWSILGTAPRGSDLD